MNRTFSRAGSYPSIQAIGLHGLGAGLAVSVGTGIDGIGQHVVNSGVARIDPADVVTLVHLHRKRQAFRLVLGKAACRCGVELTQSRRVEILSVDDP